MYVNIYQDEEVFDIIVNDGDYHIKLKEDTAHRSFTISIEVDDEEIMNKTYDTRTLKEIKDTYEEEKKEENNNDIRLRSITSRAGVLFAEVKKLATQKVL